MADESIIAYSHRVELAKSLWKQTQFTAVRSSDSAPESGGVKISLPLIVPPLPGAIRGMLLDCTSL